MSAVEMGEDNRNIWLFYSADQPLKGYPEYHLYADDPDGDEKEFEPIAYSAIETLGAGHVALYAVNYHIRKQARRRLFCGWRPPRYCTTDCASLIKQHLIESGWQDGLFADHESYKESKVLWSKYRDYIKQLCILQEKLDMELFRRTDQTYGEQPKERVVGSRYSGVRLTVFPEQTIQRQDSAETTIAHYKERTDFILMISADIILPRAYFTLNPSYMSVEELIEQLKPIATEYNKNLEVHI